MSRRVVIPFVRKGEDDGEIRREAERLDKVRLRDPVKWKYIKAQASLQSLKSLLDKNAPIDLIIQQKELLHRRINEMING